MAVTIDGRKLKRKLEGKYGAYSEPRDHWRFFWHIEGKICGGAKLSHSRKARDLPDFVVSSVAHKLGVSRDELKIMEQCRFSREQLIERLRTRSV